MIYEYRGKEFPNEIEKAKYVLECDKNDKLNTEKVRQERLKVEKTKRKEELDKACDEYNKICEDAYSNYVETCNTAKEKYNKKYNKICNKYAEDYREDYIKEYYTPISSKDISKLFGSLFL